MNATAKSSIDARKNNAASRLLSNPIVDPSDSIEVACLLAPIDHGKGPDGLLALALRHQRPASEEDLERLAGTHSGGADEAWSNAFDALGLEWLVDGIQMASSRGRALAMRGIAMKFIGMASPSQIRGCKGLSQKLLIFGSEKELGAIPYLLAAKKAGWRLSEPHGEPAALLARHPAIVEAYALEGGRMDQDCSGKPFWEALRDNAKRAGETEIHELCSQWARQNAPKELADTTNAAYFSRLDTYGGEKHARSRSDWAEARDALGRGVLMVCCLRRSPSIKEFWKTKKAASSARILDNDGRSVWHAICANAKEAPKGVCAYLANEAGIGPHKDKLGRGIFCSIASSYAQSPSGKTREAHIGSEHSWGFDYNPETDSMLETSSNALVWFGSERPQDDEAFAHWLCNERYLGSKSNYGYSYGGHSFARSIKAINKIVERCAPESLAALPPFTAGALLFNLALDQGAVSEKTLAIANRLLEAAPKFSLSEERRSFLNDHGAAGVLEKIDSWERSRQEASEIGESMGELGAQSASAPSKRI